MKTNAKILSRLLISAGIILWLIAKFLISNPGTKSGMIYISFGISMVAILTMLVFEAGPALFKKRTGGDRM